MTKKYSSKFGTVPNNSKRKHGLNCHGAGYFDPTVDWNHIFFNLVPRGSGSNAKICPVTRGSESNSKFLKSGGAW
jgi:hypothetical protein